MQTPTVLTGDRPTGQLHLGHYAGSLLQRVAMQDQGVRCFVMVADLQAYTDNADNAAKVSAAIPEVVADYVSAGIDPDRTTIFLQSSVPELSELAMLYLNLVTVSRLERNPTVREEIRQRGFERDIPAGFLCYPASQAADITGFKATHVPVGDDQLPMIELAQEVARKVNRMAGTEVLPLAEAVLSSVTRLPGTDGSAKASKSLGNAIYMADSADQVARKVMSMFTDPGHLTVNDPGKVEGNAVFAYLDAFDPAKDEVEALKHRYRAGGLGDVALKRRLQAVLDAELSPVRERRARFLAAGDPVEVLRAGAVAAREAVASTLSQVRRSLGMLVL